MIHHKVIKWIGVICFSILALSCIILIQNFLSVTPSDTEPTVIANWDICRFGTGLLNDAEIDLTTEEENALGSLIFNYPLRQITQEELSRKETVYGAPYYTVIFMKADIMSLWIFGANSFVQHTINNGISEWIYYDTDRELLSLIDHFND